MGLLLVLSYHLIQLPIDKQVSLDGKKKAEFVRDLHLKVRPHIEKKTKLYAENANKGRKRVVFEPGDCKLLGST